MLETILANSAVKKCTDFLSDQLLGRWKAHQRARDVIALHKRRILNTSITNVLWAELHAFREAFLEHGLAELNADNQLFFDRWLTKTPVVMGWMPGSGWTRATIAEMCADLSRVRA